MGEGAHRRSRAIAECCVGKAVDLAESVHSKTELGKDGSHSQAPAAEQVFDRSKAGKSCLAGRTKTAVSFGAMRQKKRSFGGGHWPSRRSALGELAHSLGAPLRSLADRWKFMLLADVVTSATGCPTSF